MSATYMSMTGAKNTHILSKLPLVSRLSAEASLELDNDAFWCFLLTKSSRTLYGVDRCRIEGLVSATSDTSTAPRQSEISPSNHHARLFSRRLINQWLHWLSRRVSDMTTTFKNFKPLCTSDLAQTLAAAMEYRVVLVLRAEDVCWSQRGGRMRECELTVSNPVAGYGRPCGAVDAAIVPSG